MGKANERRRKQFSTQLEPAVPTQLLQAITEHPKDGRTEEGGSAEESVFVLRTNIFQVSFIFF